jgi:hypothetical protein
MNTEFVSINLREAREELDKAINAAESGDELGLRMWLAWTYRKLNLSWNARNLSGDEVHAKLDQFETWCEFPNELLK